MLDEIELMSNDDLIASVTRQLSPHLAVGVIDKDFYYSVAELICRLRCGATVSSNAQRIIDDREQSISDMSVRINVAMREIKSLKQEIKENKATIKNTSAEKATLLEVIMTAIKSLN